MQHLEQYLTYQDIADRVSRSASTVKRWASESYMGFPRPQYLGKTAMFKESNTLLSR